MTRARQTIAHLPVEQLTANPANVRDDLGDLTDLARSILELGVLEPLLVTEHPDGGYLLLDGHRRLGAGSQLGMKSFPVIIRHDVADTAEQIVTMLATDVHKKAFTPMQRARAYGHLRDVEKLTGQQIAKRVGVSTATVATYLNMLHLQHEIAEQARRRRDQGDRRPRLGRRAAPGRARGRRQACPGPTERTGHFGVDHPLAAAARAMCRHKATYGADRLRALLGAGHQGRRGRNAGRCGMTPTDPRHGTVAGFVAHGRAGVPACEPCLTAKRRYEKTRQIHGHRKVPALGTHRRVHALRALGHSLRDICRAAGWADKGSLNYAMGAETITAATALRVAQVYEQTEHDPRHRTQGQPDADPRRTQRLAPAPRLGRHRQRRRPGVRHRAGRHRLGRDRARPGRPAGADDHCRAPSDRGALAVDGSPLQRPGPPHRLEGRALPPRHRGRRMTQPPPITRIPNAGDPRLPAREDRDWVLSTELLDEAGITYRQLDYWCRTGLLTPREDIHGSGWTRSFGPDQVDRAWLIRSLLSGGVSLQVIRERIDEFQANGTADIGPLTITIHHPSGDTAA
jgi:ParB/RepB/Spo0J family partition protein